MKKEILFCLFLLIGTNIYSQVKVNRDSSFALASKLSLLINLTDDQEQQIYLINRHFDTRKRRLLDQKLSKSATADSLSKYAALKEKLYRAVFIKSQYQLYVEARNSKLID